jgi:hypothetical protein
VNAAFGAPTMTHSEVVFKAIGFRNDVQQRQIVLLAEPHWNDVNLVFFFYSPTIHLRPKKDFQCLETEPRSWCLGRSKPRRVVQLWGFVWIRFQEKYSMKTYDCSRSTASIICDEITMGTRTHNTSRGWYWERTTLVVPLMVITPKECIFFFRVSSTAISGRQLPLSLIHSPIVVP